KIAEEITDEMHIAGLKLKEIDEETGFFIIGAEEQNTHVFLADKSVLPQLKELLLNKKVGDEFNFAPNMYDSYAPKKLYKVEITTVQSITPAEFNNQFVEKYSQGRFNTTDDLREEIGFSMQEEWNSKARTAMEDQIVEKLVEMHEFDIPQTVVYDVIESMYKDMQKRYGENAKNLDFNEVAKGLVPLAEKIVKWEIIRNKIIETEGIAVEDYDISGLAEREAERSKTDVETVKAAMMKNKNLTVNILHKKVMDFILDFTTTNEVSFEEFDRLHAHDHDHEGDDHDQGHHHDEDGHAHDHDHEGHDHDHGHHHHHEEDNHDESDDDFEEETVEEVKTK
ncbi:MAG: hypothetical protein WCT77_03290, partial [Bacteroidota bacterium]